MHKGRIEPTIVLRDDGERLGLHPRGQAGRRRDVGRTAGRREDGGTTGGRQTTGGQRGDGRMAGRREDGGQWVTTLGAHWGLGDAGERENDVVG